MMDNRQTKNIFLKISTGVAVIIWIHTIYPDIKYYLPYYNYAIHANSIQLQRSNTVYCDDSIDDSTVDYYTILKYCNSILPKGEMIQIVLPQTPQKRSHYRRQQLLSAS